MIRYVKEDTTVAFAEIPNETSLCLNISNCQNSCVGCHSPYLKKNIGEYLDYAELDKLAKENEGITCICLMGEGNDFCDIIHYGAYIHNILGLKSAVYSGREDIPEAAYWDVFDYIKIGPYKAEFGPLNSKTTNQRLYHHNGEKEAEIEINGVKHQGWTDITHKFWEK